MILVLLSARADGIGPSPKGAGRYHLRADNRFEIKTTVWCFLCHISKIKEFYIRKIIYYKKLKIFFRSYKSFYSFLCVRIWSVRVVGLCWQIGVVSSVEGSLSSEMEHCLLEFKIIEKETLFMQLRNGSNSFTEICKFPVRFNSLKSISVSELLENVHKRVRHLTV